MNLDLTYCQGRPNGNECPIKQSCKQWIGHYEIPEPGYVWMFDGYEGNCPEYWPTEDMSE